MIKTYTVGLLLLFFAITTQAQFTDDFTDGNFTANPTWSGDDSVFIVNVSNQLQSNSSTINTTYYLSTPSTIATNAQWELFVKLAFSTSGANYVDVFLTSDQQDVKQPLNGYFVRIGGTPDEISLYRKDGSTNTKIIDGVDGHSQTSTTNNQLKIKVTRDNTSNWLLADDTTGTGNNYFAEGNITDNTYLTSSFFGIAITQSTATFFGKHFFDDVYVGSIVTDTIPPQISNLTVINSNSLNVLFSEPVEQLSAETISNYVANNGIGSPQTALRDAANQSLVHLIFATTFPANILDTLTINNVTDTLANMILPNTQSTFTYIVAVIPSPFDIVINEIMFDPDPAVGLPAVAEFVELYNRSNKTFNLNGWTFSDASSAVTFGSQTILPNSYLIVCKKDSDFLVYGTTVGFSSFPSLNNTGGETLTIKDNASTIIDEVYYDETYYHDPTKSVGGWSIERVDPDYTCVNELNWKASVDVKGGSPGVINSVYAAITDTVAPSVLFTCALDSIHVQLFFSEVIADTALSNINNYTLIVNGTTNFFPLASVPSSDHLSVILTTPFNISSQSAPIEIKISATVSDCPGNAIGNNSQFFQPGQIANENDVVITEIMFDPDPTVNLPNGEFVDIYNRSNKTFDLNGWTFNGATSLASCGSNLLPPGGYLILCSIPFKSSFSVYGATLAFASFPTLNNTGGKILSFSDNTGKIINKVYYDETFYQDATKNDGGWTIEQIDPDFLCTNKFNWKASTDVNGGTPGRANSVDGVFIDNVAPTVLHACPIDSNHIQLFFSEEIADSALNNINNYLLKLNSSTIFLPLAALADTNLLSVTLTTTFNIISQTIPIIISVNTTISDCAGNAIGTNSTSLQWGQQAAANDVVINEVLFSVKTGGAEFVELYNNSTKPIDVTDLRITRIDLVTGQPDAPVEIVTDCFVLLPQHYLVLTKNPDAVKSQYNNNPDAFIKMNLPDLLTDEDIIVLQNAAGQTLDQFHYYSTWHFPLLNDAHGVSLERINPNRITQDKSNWHSASETSGFATPGLRNSQYSDATGDGSTITINPEIFSPDNDGMDDVANISYHFDQPGFTAKVDVFDDRGRLMTHLINNELIGTDGTWSWNGITDKNEKARIGIYIIYMEAFNLNGDVKKYRKTCVLAGKL